jgi:PTS system nitrogen regulatory IIA component
LVLPGLAARSAEDLVRAVAEALGRFSNVDRTSVERAFLEALRTEGFSVGRGVAIPHIEIESLTETRVCLATLRAPLRVTTIDGRPPDIFLFILSKPDPQAHLLLLAHLAHLTQSRTLLEGLRRAQRPDEAVALLRAAEMRHAAKPQADVTLAPHALIIISVSGEKAVDALLIDLVDQGFGDACILEAQSLREAAAREVPLFAGFRDLFGDPGGRRMLVLETPSDRAGTVLEAVRRISKEYRAREARVSVIPVQTEWIVSAAPSDEAAGEQ